MFILLHKCVYDFRCVCTFHAFYIMCCICLIMTTSKICIDKMTYYLYFFSQGNLNVYSNSVTDKAFIKLLRENGRSNLFEKLHFTLANIGVEK